MLKGSELRSLSWIWPNFKLCQALMHIILTCKYEKYGMKNRSEKVATPFFPFITLWELSVAMITRVLIGSGLKLNVRPYKAFIESENGALIP